MAQHTQNPLSQRILLTRKQFEESYGSKYQGKKCSEVLEERGVFDQPKGTLRYTSRQLPVINLLGLYTHFSGTLYAGAINTQGGLKGFDGNLGISGKHIPELLPLFEKELGISVQGREKEYRLGKNGKVYARLLHMLGFSTSTPFEKESLQRQNTKAQRNAQLPRYLLDLEEEYDSFSKEDQKLARRHLRDVVAVLFDSCRKEYEERKANSVLVLRVMSRRTPELVREEAATQIRIMNCAYPGLEASVEENFFPVTPDKEAPYYQGTIKFEAREIARVSTPESLFPAKLTIKLEPRFSYQLRRNLKYFFLWYGS